MLASPAADLVGPHSNSTLPPDCFRASSGPVGAAGT